MPFLAFAVVVTGQVTTIPHEFSRETSLAEAEAIAAATQARLSDIHSFLALTASHLRQKNSITCEDLQRGMTPVEPVIAGLAIVSAGRQTQCGGASITGLPLHPSPGRFHLLGSEGKLLTFVSTSDTLDHAPLVAALIHPRRLLDDAISEEFKEISSVDLVDEAGHSIASVSDAGSKAPEPPFAHVFTAPVGSSGYQIRVARRVGGGVAVPDFLPLLASALLLLFAAGGAFIAHRPPEARRLSVAPAQEPCTAANRVACPLDRLTGLPNRRAFHQDLQEAMRRAEKHEWLLALIIVDIDRFRAVNDTLGHQAGDALIELAAWRLQRCDPGSYLARIGDDEFGIILENVAGAAAVEAWVRQLLRTVGAAYDLRDHEIYVTASVGVALYPLADIDLDTLMAKAYTAMSRAKLNGRDRFEFFAAKMKRRSIQQLVLENSLRQALHRCEFVLHYQPQFDLVTGRAVGVEALLRWQHPERGLMAPGEFVSLLEETGLVVDVGNWALRTACHQVAQWHRLGYGRLRVAVNLSALQFRQNDLAKTIAGVLLESGLQPGDLELELTESLLMGQREARSLAALRQTGVNIAIDDFGTGYSSLSYLRRFPVNAVKIDREFIREVESQPDDATILDAIIRLAHSLGFRVVAEGVESTGQLATLKRYGCDEVQGYLLGHPLAAELLPPILKQPQRAFL